MYEPERLSDMTLPDVLAAGGWPPLPERLSPWPLYDDVLAPGGWPPMPERLSPWTLYDVLASGGWPPTPEHEQVRAQKQLRGRTPGGAGQLRPSLAVGVCAGWQHESLGPQLVIRAHQNATHSLTHSLARVLVQGDEEAKAGAASAASTPGPDGAGQRWVACLS